MNKNKVSVILKYLKSKNMGEVRFFLKLYNFYRRFIKEYFGIIKTLTDLIKKEVT